MAVYLLVPLELAKQNIDKSVTDKISATERFQLQNERGWLISYPGTSVELSDFLDIAFQPKEGDGRVSVGSAIIVPLSQFYYGRGNKDMWEWIRVKLTDQ